MMEISFTRVCPFELRGLPDERIGPSETLFESPSECDAPLRFVSRIECRAFRFARSEFMYTATTESSESARIR